MSAAEEKRSMRVLSRSLKVISLPSLARFLTGLLHSGTLHVTLGPLAGDVHFDAGQVVAASLGSERGLAALDAIALALAEGQFAFADGPPPEERNVELTAGQMQAHLDDLAKEKVTLAAILPSL